MVEKVINLLSLQSRLTVFKQTAYQFELKCKIQTFFALGFVCICNLILISQLSWSRGRREGMHGVTSSQKQGFV